MLRSQVAYELEYRRQLQVQSALTHALSVTRTPGLLREIQGRDPSDPGSCGSQDRYLLHGPSVHVEQQSMSTFESRLQNLEKNYQQKVNELESRCASLQHKVQI